MKNIFNSLRRWLFAPIAGERHDPLQRFSAREWADLPTYHPPGERMPSPCETGR